MYRFPNRREAGRVLAHQLMAYAHRPDVIVLALPRGGVPIGYEVAMALHAPLDVLVVRKIGVPHNPELAMGAVASGRISVLDTQLIHELQIAPHALEKAIADAMYELERRERAYRDGRPAPTLTGRTVILVDDGLATGATMTAAIEAVHREHPRNIIVAAPVASRDACTSVRQIADRCVTSMMPEPLYGVGRFYDDFTQVSDDEVRELLAENAWKQEPSARLPTFAS